MKVTSVEIHPSGSSDVCVLSFKDPRRQNPYNVKAIVGIDANDIVPKYYGSSGNSNFYNMSIEKREPVIRIELNPRFNLGESYSSLRDMLYKFISSSRTGIIQLQFKNGDDVIAAISGLVVKFEATHFEKIPEVQITIKCQDPMLRAVSPIAVDVMGLDPEQTIIDDALSTAPHGLKCDIEFSGTLASFNIEGEESSTFEVTPVGGFLGNDVLHLSSEYNDKRVYLTRGANTIHLADVITPGSIWPIIFPGVNTFVCDNPSFLSWVSISYYPTYWGV